MSEPSCREEGGAGSGPGSERDSVGLPALPTVSVSQSLSSPRPRLSVPSLGPLPLVPASPLGLPGGACAESGPRLTRWLLSYHQQLQGLTGRRPLGGESVSTVASVPAPVDGAHGAQGEVSLREPLLGPPGRALGEVLSPLLGQSKSGVADIRATLEGQVLSRGDDRALRGQEGGLPRQPWERQALGCWDRFPCGPPSPVPAPGLAVSQSVCLSCEPHAPLPTLSQGLPWEQRPQYVVLSAQMYVVRTGLPHLRPGAPGGRWGPTTPWGCACKSCSI